jgi:mono/diheme cytochrome c family protein
MRCIIVSILIAGVFALLGGFAVIYTGAYDVAATSPHWPVTSWVMETARIRSIKAHAASIQAPPSFDDPANIPIGVEHFAAHCAVCHGAPGVPRGDIAQGLYPPPPDLAKTAPFYSSAELFWIVINGIKMTGMPAWSDHSDAELWGTVAFVKEAARHERAGLCAACDSEHDAWHPASSRRGRPARARSAF